MVISFDQFEVMNSRCICVSRSPDGLCLLTNSDDNQLRVFEIPFDRLPLNEDLVKNNHLSFLIDNSMNYSECCSSSSRTRINL
jgi:hypothetical protein